MAEEIFKLKNIQLDTFLDKNNNPITYFSQGDRLSDKLYIDLSNRDTEIDLATATQVRIDFRKPDKKLVFQYCLIEDAAKGIVSVILNSQTVAVAGEVYAEVTVIYPNGKRVVTRQFTFLVTEAIASDASIESSDFAPMIDRAVELGDLMDAANVTPQQIVNAGSLAANALPKTGGTMTGTLNMQASIGIEGDRNIYRKDGAEAFDKGFTLTSGSVRLHDWKNNRTVWEYDQVGNTFNVNSNTNLVKKTGDTMTGDLQINTPNKGFKVGNGVEGITQMVDTNGRYYWYSTLAKTPFYYDIKADNFVVSAPNTNLVTKAKDGRADLVLTADATAINPIGYPNVATRRGNTVTVNLAVTRNVGSTGNIVATLPVDMRPIDNFYRYVLSEDGTAVYMMIKPDGGIRIDASGKNMYISETYVVN